MKKTIENLQENGFKVFHVKNAQKALETAKPFFLEIESVGLGGSESVREIGLLDWMYNQKTFKLINQYEQGISIKENEERRKWGLLSDLYVTSSNAVSESGYLINIDGSGNRVAALSYGPKRILLIIGKNKIVKNVEEGLKRINDIATPKNVERLNNKAVSHNKPQKYTVDNIQNYFSVIKKSDVNERIIVILVDEELGY